jgi:hypothetical protein
MHKTWCRVTVMGVVVGQLVEEAGTGNERSTSGRYPKLGAQRRHGPNVGPGLRGWSPLVRVRNAPDTGLTGRGRGREPGDAQRRRRCDETADCVAAPDGLLDLAA